ncbi:hypothetical protein PMI11_02909 [Rhizobium sp. CF142]|nr:hypothetical protein PMI11_02909 [Rhizobium sp. CF142]
MLIHRAVRHRTALQLLQGPAGVAVRLMDCRLRRFTQAHAEGGNRRRSQVLLVGNIDVWTIACFDMLPVPGAVLRLEEDLGVAALNLLAAGRPMGCRACRRVVRIGF